MLRTVTRFGSVITKVHYSHHHQYQTNPNSSRIFNHKPNPKAVDDNYQRVLLAPRDTKHSELALVVGHRDGVVRTYELPQAETGTTSSRVKCTASFETKGGPIQSVVVHDVTKLSISGDVVTADSRGLITVFSNEHILCRKAVSDQCISCLQIDTDATGNFGIVTADREGNMCSFTPYFDLWRLRLLDVRQSKVGVGGRPSVTCMQAVMLKSSDGHTSNYVLVADERQQLYFIQHGTVVLILQTPAVITAMCCGRFVSIDDIENAAPSASSTSTSVQHLRNAAFDTQVALATETGSIYIMTNFQIYEEAYANIHLPIGHLRAISVNNVDLLLIAGNCDAFTVLNSDKVLASFPLPSWTSAIAVADVDKDGVAEVIIGCRDNSVHGLKLIVS